MYRLVIPCALLAISLRGYASETPEAYIQTLEKSNAISYDTIRNSSGASITPMCYTKTKDTPYGKVYNPCYICHTRGETPNYTNDSNLQLVYDFPGSTRHNPYNNLFKDRSKSVNAISDADILRYIRHSNYFDADGSLTLAKSLPKDWSGYRPDCYFHFDAQGFDYDPDGHPTLWRAFRYYPLAGTFWPTNGSTDDVLIRLPRLFAQERNGRFSLNVYALNLSIVEALIKQKDITLPTQVDEALYGVDLNQNGKFDSASHIVYLAGKMHYAGRANEAQKSGTVHLAGGLYPEGTEFLHTVRYLDWDETQGHTAMSARLKELRYSRKYRWSTYAQIAKIARSELREIQISGNERGEVAFFRGDYAHGLRNETGWVYQGYIEDRTGKLRPQTKEESIHCMGCHSGLGVTTDSSFAFPRKFEGDDGVLAGWKHWNQQDMTGVPEPKSTYQGFGEQYAYSFYLRHNDSGNEFRDNDEVARKFFTPKGEAISQSFAHLHSDISWLLYPSKERALHLDKAYRVIVEEQSFIYGRDAHILPMRHVWKEVNDTATFIDKPIIPEYR